MEIQIKLHSLGHAWAEASAIALNAFGVVGALAQRDDVAFIRRSIFSPYNHRDHWKCLERQLH